MKNVHLTVLFLFFANLFYSQNIQMVKDINPNGDSQPQSTKVENYISNGTVYSKLFFCAFDSLSYKLFISDGTASGTESIASYTNTKNFKSILGIGQFYPRVLFSASDNVYGYEPRYTNGTSSSTALLKDCNPGVESSYPSPFTISLYTGYFSANTSDTTRGLFKTNGTSSGTTLIKSFPKHQTYNVPYNIYLYNSKLLFSAYQPSTGIELWLSDGTANGTNLLKDIIPGNTNSLIYLDGIVYNNLFYFTAQKAIDDYELFVTDGTTSGTMLFKEINSNGSSNPYSFFIYNNLLYFFAKTDTAVDLYATNGNSLQTNLMIDLNDHPYYFSEVYNGKMFYSNTRGDIYVIDLVNNTHSLIKELNITSYNYPFFYWYNGYVYFNVASSTGNELWRSAGTPETTQQLLPSSGIVTFPGDPSYFAEYNGSLYFTAIFNGYGYELWKLTDSTTMLPPTFELVSEKNIYPNPAYDVVNIKSLNSKYIYIYNSMGQKIIKTENKENPIVVSHLPAGIYMVRDEQGNYIGKFIKQ